MSKLKGSKAAKVLCSDHVNIDVPYLIASNWHGETDVKRLWEGVEVMEKYAFNLVTTNSPPNTATNFTISLSNKTFMERVLPINGHLEVLKSMGYRINNYNGVLQVVRKISQSHLEKIHRDLKNFKDILSLWRMGDQSVLPKINKFVWNEKNEKDFSNVLFASNIVRTEASFRQLSDLSYDSSDSEENSDENIKKETMRLKKSQSVGRLNKEEVLGIPKISSMPSFQCSSIEARNNLLFYKESDNSIEAEKPKIHPRSFSVYEEIRCREKSVSSLNAKFRYKRITKPPLYRIPPLTLKLRRELCFNKPHSKVSPPFDLNTWTCHHCTFINKHSLKCCHIQTSPSQYSSISSQNNDTSFQNSTNPSQSTSASSDPTSREQFPKIFTKSDSYLTQLSTHICQGCYKTSKILCSRQDFIMDQLPNDSVFKKDDFCGELESISNSRFDRVSDSSREIIENKAESDCDDLEDFENMNLGLFSNSGQDVETDCREKSLKRSNTLRFYSLMEIISKKIGRASDKEILFLKGQLSLDVSPRQVVDCWLETVRRFIGMFGEWQEGLDQGLVEIIKECLIDNNGNENLAKLSFENIWNNRLNILKSECFIPGLTDQEYNQTLSICLGNVHDSKIALVKQQIFPDLGSEEERWIRNKIVGGEDLYGSGVVMMDVDVLNVLRKEDGDDDDDGDDDGDDGDKESKQYKRRVRMLLAEGEQFGAEDCDGGEKVLMLVHLVNQRLSNQGKEDDDERARARLQKACEVDVMSCIEACKIYPIPSEAVDHLIHECQICRYEYPKNQIVKFIECQCEFCKVCGAEYFKERIKTKIVEQLDCPLCNLPKIDREFNCCEYFIKLDLVLKSLLEEETVQQFRVRLVEWSCENGTNEIIINCLWCNLMMIAPRDKKSNIICLYCKRMFCLKCTWRGNGHHICKVKDEPKPIQDLIECPGCREQFELVNGGCIHLKCTKCSLEFCRGCRNLFTHKGKKGLYCRCDRDCLSNLRELDLSSLKQLLQINGIECQNLSSLSPSISSSPPSLSSQCPIKVQSEENTSETPCPRKSSDSFSGFCEAHYVEHVLVYLINKHKLDPVHIMNKFHLELFLERFSTDDDNSNSNNNNNNNDSTQSRIAIFPNGLQIIWSNNDGVDRLREILSTYFPISR